MSYLQKSVTTLKGVGKVRAEQLQRLGINTVEDLVYFFPRAYENRGNVRLISECQSENPVSLILTVGTSVKTARIPKKMTISKFRAFDDSGAIEIVFFNSEFVKDVFTVGATFRFYGKITFSAKGAQMASPKYEPYFESVPLPDFVPVYPLTSGLSSKVIDKLMATVIDEAVANIRDHVPAHVLEENSLPSLSVAIRNAHFPMDERTLSLAISRLAFDEMLTFGLGIALQSSFRRSGGGIRLSPCNLDPILKLLPYELTDDQKKAVNDIYRDTVLGGADGNCSPMARIIVGDVGSGKTVCSLLAIYITLCSGYQAALMVPTEILARQHYAEIKGYLSALGYNVEILLGSTTSKEKNRIYGGIEDGSVDLIIGTHALISDKLAFNKLGLVITDEQHRFGVAQRSTLIKKGNSVHMLVMSATPIPRTLALTMYGDLDVSRIKQMPKGRMRVDTFVVDEGYRERLNDFIRKQVHLGGQCYVVCPAIEHVEGDDNAVAPNSITAPFDNVAPVLTSAVEHTERLRAAMPELAIECLHGKLSSKEKDSIMQRFAAGEIDVLVSTTVIEIGINVPNACLMIIECAERFGLSSLHQLRGRVGRGQRKSYCVLVSNMKTEKAMQRLEIMRSTYDGYEIAERDLIMRGPGDFFSRNSDDNFRQSGGFNFKFAKLCDDNRLFEAAFSTAKSIVMRDPKLALPEHEALHVRLESIIRSHEGNIS